MAEATRTVNPLHFEDLEPKRFEDLARQLVYDFRRWESLEATGRSGNDEGFDARGIEATDDPKYIEADPSDVEVEAHAPKVWLIQCKREKAIPPSKMKAHLEAIPPASLSALHGVLFVAACDVSKGSRDAFRAWHIQNGISEGVLWSRGELEDALFRPENDHLLFAYFGISLKIRQRSLRASVRSRLAMKKQTIRVLGSIGGKHCRPVLLRDASANAYPYSAEVVNFDARPLWRAYNFIAHQYNGIELLIGERLAYLGDDGESWDVEERVRVGRPFEDPWPPERDEEMHGRALLFWRALPDANRATLRIIGLVPYEAILAIDEHGDPIFEHPHIYLDFDQRLGPFVEGYHEQLLTYAPVRVEHEMIDEKRVRFFPAEYPVPEQT